MADLGEMKNFYKDKRVLVTGHTGFKGAWLCRLLLDMGAKVYGYALAPERESLYGLLDWEKGLVSCYEDIRQPKKLAAFVKKAEPEVVFHLAAQPLVSVGYAQPVRTYETNLMGTVYLLEALRKVESLRSVVVVTTDKVYAETKEAAGEESPLDVMVGVFCRGKRHCPVCGQGTSLAAVILLHIVSCRTASGRRWNESLLFCGIPKGYAPISMCWSL